ncbi:GvpL/GvpF family gas vesicle protein [Nocardia sp. CDC160]|uniref:GvpL/GvpF family gas vesicle protein n=1 Tax=Nocardia sp. CDC160 TaxID=3112166 RepID=UPI002DB56069|nr:GvpL/GvpF family gas vesicle protein [Nocardia sp. CDC160]MEC3919024.1 GvpL/GvpF family gas vesicle protein [Nocardia sp. CDC160]
MTESQSETARTQASSNTALLLYGIVPADAKPKGHGVGRAPAPVRTIPHGRIAALVSEVPLDEPLDRAEDLQGFSRVVDEMVSETAIIPIRFGAALEDEAAVESGLLEPNEKKFGAALEDLKGLAEYLVIGQYVEETVLREILQEDQQAAALSETLRSAPPEAGRDVSLALGETINADLEQKRETDTTVMVNALSELTNELVLRPPTHEQEVAAIAVLIPLDKEKELVHIADQLSQQWNNRVVLRVVGPLAAWDFMSVEATDNQ